MRCNHILSLYIVSETAFKQNAEKRQRIYEVNLKLFI